MLEIDFRYVFDADNADSLTENVAWHATLYRMPNYELVCDVRNNGITGTHITWHGEGEQYVTSIAIEAMPDSIDPVRDWIDFMLQEQKEQIEES